MFWVSNQLWIRYDTVLFDSSPQYFVCLPSATMSCRIPFQCFCSSAHQGWSCHLRNGTSSDFSAVISDQRHVWSLNNPHLCLAVLDIMKRGDWREILHIPRRQPATTWMLFLEDVITWQHIIQKNKIIKSYMSYDSDRKKPSVGKQILRPIIGSHNKNP